jgi:muconolactone delta-isomerase
VREQTISKLLDLIYETVEKLTSGKYCFANHLESFCSHIQLAFLVKVLHSLQLGSQRVLPTEVRASIQDITQKIHNFDWKDLYRITGQYRHFCYFGVQLKPEIDKILEDISSMILENHTQRMEEQAKKSGVGNLKVPNAKDD